MGRPRNGQHCRIPRQICCMHRRRQRDLDQGLRSRYALASFFVAFLNSITYGSPDLAYQATFCPQLAIHFATFASSHSEAILQVNYSRLGHGLTLAPPHYVDLVIFRPSARLRFGGFSRHGNCAGPTVFLLAACHHVSVASVIHFYLRIAPTFVARRILMDVTT
jgi:hypothetical protein